MAKTEPTWNHRPSERGEGFCHLWFTLTLACCGQTQREAGAAALFPGGAGARRRLPRYLADRLAVAAEDALAARLVGLGPKRLNRDGIFLFAHLYIEPANPARGAVTLRVDVGSIPRWLIEDGPERPRSEWLLEGINCVLDEPGSGAAVATAVDGVLHRWVEQSLGADAVGFAWRVDCLGQTP